jgi:amino acid adenylation domain-containing protein
MKDSTGTYTLPTEQEIIRAKCVHPTGTFIEFKKEEIEQSIPDRFERIVAEYPDRIAIKTTTHALTYDELNKRANRVARAILAKRGEAKEPIALLVEDHSPMLTAILGVLKAGKIYVPMDPSYPRPRIALMLEDSQARLIVGDNHSIALVNELTGPGGYGLNIDELTRTTVSDDNLGLSIAPETIAYIMHTSGSTGQPKGVIQSHRNVLQKVMTHTNDFHISADDRLSLLYSCSFNASVRNIFGALLNGAALFPFNIKKEGMTGLGNWMNKEKVTIYFSVPTLFRHFVETLNETEEILSIRLIYLGGESVTIKDVELFKKNFSADCILINSMASNETGTVRQYFMDKETEIEGSVVPVGYEVRDKEVLLLDDEGEKVGFNQIGEIAIRSRYLALGYWRRPDLTQAKFQLDPNSRDESIYLTGDIGLMLPDGCLYHMGRKDFQAKTRGYRVEISEIETALINLETIKEAIVLAQEDPAGNKRLVAYIVSIGKAPGVTALRRALAEKLPEYMVPSAFVVLDAMPLTPSGKIDRQALPDPGNARPHLDTPFVSPATPVEKQVAQVWAQVLGLDQVGVHDNFFELGGHSLAATRVVARVIEHFQLELPLSSLFQAPTVAEMALVILESRANKLDESNLDSILSDLEALSEEDARRVLARAMQRSNEQS